MAEAAKARVVGFNHVALEVGDIEAARKALVDAGIETLPRPFLDFRDP